MISQHRSFQKGQAAEVVNQHGDKKLQARITPIKLGKWRHSKNCGPSSSDTSCRCLNASWIMNPFLHGNPLPSRQIILVTTLCNPYSTSTSVRQTLSLIHGNGLVKVIFKHPGWFKKEHQAPAVHVQHHFENPTCQGTQLPLSYLNKHLSGNFQSASFFLWKIRTWQLRHHRTTLQGPQGTGTLWHDIMTPLELKPRSAHSLILVNPCTLFQPSTSNNLKSDLRFRSWIVPQLPRSVPVLKLLFCQCGLLQCVRQQNIYAQMWQEGESSSHIAIHTAKLHFSGQPWVAKPPDSAFKSFKKDSGTCHFKWMTCDVTGTTQRETQHANKLEGFQALSKRNSSSELMTWRKLTQQCCLQTVKPARAQSRSRHVSAEQQVLFV